MTTSLCNLLFCEPFALFRSAERAEPNAVDLEEAGEVVLAILPILLILLILLILVMSNKSHIMIQLLNVMTRS
jgi:uncharacterized integral membrane protein